MRKILNILILAMTFCVQGQISESWNLNTDTYNHNSSNYSSKYPPIEIVKLSNDNKVVLSQNGTLIKFNNNGEIIWQKKISNCFRQSLSTDENDNIYLSCNSDITKLDSSGATIWKKDYSSIFTREYVTFDAITTHDNKIYVAGHFTYSKYICQLAVDNDGTVLWKKSYRQNVNSEFNFLPPKQIIVHNESIYILAHEYYSFSKSILYCSDLNGKKRKKTWVNHKLKKLRSYNEFLFAVGQFDNKNEKLILIKLNNDIEIIDKLEFSLPRKIEHNKSLRGYSSKPTKKELEKKHFTTYKVNDFEFLNDNSLLVVGDSSKRPWIAKLDLKKGIIWNYDNNDKRYYKYNNEFTMHSYSLFSIDKVKDKYLISGISEEQDDHEEMFIRYINLFVREIELEK
jgi:hypothetical protein